MSKIRSFAASLALVSFGLASAFLPAAAHAAQSGGGSAGGAAAACQVKVSRSASAGVFNVTRQLLNNGKCVCRVTTGPRSQGGSAETALGELVRGRNCSAAQLTTGAASGSTGIFPLIGAGAAAAAGIGVGIATGGNSSSP